MSEITDNAEVKDFGFTVYDAENGGIVCATYDDGGDSFMLAQDGTLFVIDDAFWIGKKLGREVREVPKEGRYIIQFDDESYMRY